MGHPSHPPAYAPVGGVYTSLYVVYMPYTEGYVSVSSCIWCVYILLYSVYAIYTGVHVSIVLYMVYMPYTQGYMSVSSCIWCICHIHRGTCQYRHVYGVYNCI